MREIKFRTWAYGEMRQVKGLACTDDSEKMDLVDDSLMTNDLVYDYDELENRVLMQYTGFKDKNGKEIYEGDILKSESSYDKVFWNESAWSTEVMKRHQDKGGWIVGHINTVFSVSAKYGEVVGNIYENPELLEDK